MSDRLYKILMSMCIILIIVGVFFIFSIIHMLICNYMPYKETKLTNIEYSFSSCNYPDSKEEIKHRVDKLFKNSKYSLIEVNLPMCVLGESNSFTREIKIDKSLNKIDYAFTLAHELVHINYVTASERFCNFKAFQLLYESGDEFLKNVALYTARGDIAGFELDNYSFIGYVEIYLENNKGK